MRVAADFDAAGDVSGKLVLIDEMVGSYWMNWPWTEAALNGERDALIVTQAQAARMLSCSRFTIRNMVKDGTLHPVQIRGVLRYRCSELRALAEGRPEGGT